MVVVIHMSKVGTTLEKLEVVGGQGGGGSEKRWWVDERRVLRVMLVVWFFGCVEWGFLDACFAAAWIRLCSEA